MSNYLVANRARRLMIGYLKDRWPNWHGDTGLKNKDLRLMVGRLKSTAIESDEKAIDAIGSKGKNFYSRAAWLKVRYKALLASNGCCECCGAQANKENPLDVDHIKPRSKYPQLQFELSNLQVLCRACNFGKLDRDETDWRDNIIPFPNVMGL